MGYGGNEVLLEGMLDWGTGFRVTIVNDDFCMARGIIWSGTKLCSCRMNIRGKIDILDSSNIGIREP